MHIAKTADSDTVSTYQVSSVQLVTDKKLEAFDKAYGRSPTALKRPDRSKQCHCLQFCYCASLASCITIHVRPCDH